VTGLKTKRVVWTVLFLGVTLLAIVAEIVAAVWHPAGTIPWTEYIDAYVPWPVQLTAYVALVVWLPFHFWRADEKRKAAFREGKSVGHAIGYQDGRKAERYAQVMREAAVKAGLPTDGD